MNNLFAEIFQKVFVLLYKFSYKALFEYRMYY